LTHLDGYIECPPALSLVVALWALDVVGNGRWIHSFMVLIMALNWMVYKARTSLIDRFLEHGFNV